MTDSVLLLQQVAAQLQLEGKTPSLALFRARLAGQIPPAQLFSAYQSWRANPIIATDTKRSQPYPDDAAPAVSQADNEVAARLTRIEAKLDQILTELAQR
jgi:hypothetical protein